VSNIINPYRFAAAGSSSDPDYIILEAYIDSSWTEVGEECSGRSTHKFYEITATTTVRVSGNNNVEPLYYICLGGGGGGGGNRHATGGGAGGFPGESYGTWYGFNDGTHTAYGDAFVPVNDTIYTCTVGGGGIGGRSTDSSGNPHDGDNPGKEYQGSSGTPAARSSAGANSGMGPYPRGLGISGSPGTDSTIKEGSTFVFGEYSGLDAEGKGGGGGGHLVSTTGSGTGSDGGDGGCGGGAAKTYGYNPGTGSQGGDGGDTAAPYASPGGGMGGDGLSTGGGGPGITHYLKSTSGETLAGGGGSGTTAGSANAGGSGGGEDGGFMVWSTYTAPGVGGNPSGIPWDSGHPNTGGGGGGAGYPEWGYGEYGGAPYGNQWLYPRDGTGYSPTTPWERTHATDGNSGVIILMWQVS